MSVFTELDNKDIEAFLLRFDLGALVGAQGIPAGSENTNYFVDCEHGRFVLTLIERGPEDEFPFLISLLDCLHESDLPVPYAVADRSGRKLHELKGRPALLQPRLPGQHLTQADAGHCAAVGSMIAELHLAAAHCELQRESERGPSWVLHNASQLLEKRWQVHRHWLAPKLVELESWLQDKPELTTTVIHGDLFRDNVLFTGDRISGLIDFHNAATGWALMDLAICANDWCVDRHDTTGELTLNGQRLGALLDAYTGEEGLTITELQCWPKVLQLAALRFWVSRQQYLDQHPAKPGVLIKDPEHFRKILQLHV